MQIFQAITVLLLGGLKFFLAIPLAVQYDFSFWQTFIFSCIGGLLGVMIFAEFRQAILKLYYKISPFEHNKHKTKTCSFCFVFIAFKRRNFII